MADPLKLLMHQNYFSTLLYASDRMKTELAENMSVIVENRPGAGTVIGTEAVQRSAPDGETVLSYFTTHVEGLQPLDKVMLQDVLQKKF